MRNVGGRFLWRSNPLTNFVWPRATIPLATVSNLPNDVIKREGKDSDTPTFIDSFEEFELFWAGFPSFLFNLDSDKKSPRRTSNDVSNASVPVFEEDGFVISDGATCAVVFEADELFKSEVIDDDFLDVLFCFIYHSLTIALP